MKAAEVHNLKDDELVAKLIDAKQEAFNLRFRHATGELENTARLGSAHRAGAPVRDAAGRGSWRGVRRLVLASCGRGARLHATRVRCV